MWQQVANFQLPQSIQSRIDSVNNLYINQGEIIPMYQQSLDAASGAMVNCDFFPLKITTLPTGFTPATLLEYFRTHINDFTTSAFSAYNFTFPNGVNFNDTTRFNSPYLNSVGALIHIGIIGNNGTVIESNYRNYTPPIWSNESHQFMFSTLHSPLDYAHPVGGNRGFGIYNSMSNPNEFTFYTMGVDRTWDWMDNIFDQTIFNGADQLWTNMQLSFKNFINTHGGQSSILSPVKARPKWSDVEKFLKNEIDYATLKSILGC